MSSGFSPLCFRDDANGESSGLTAVVIFSEFVLCGKGESSAYHFWWNGAAWGKRGPQMVGSPLVPQGLKLVHSFSKSSNRAGFLCSSVMVKLCLIYQPLSDTQCKSLLRAGTECQLGFVSWSYILLLPAMVLWLDWERLNLSYYIVMDVFCVGKLSHLPDWSV